MHTIPLKQITDQQSTLDQQCSQYRTGKGIAPSIVTVCGKGSQLALRFARQQLQQMQMQKIVHGCGFKPGQSLLKAQVSRWHARKIARCGLRLLVGIDIIQHGQIRLRPCRMHGIIVLHDNSTGVALAEAVCPNHLAQADVAKNRFCQGKTALAFIGGFNLQVQHPQS